MITIVRKIFAPKNDGLDSFRQKEVEISNEAADVMERLPEEHRDAGLTLFVLGRQLFGAEIEHKKAEFPAEDPTSTLESGSVDRRTREYKRNQK